MKLKFRYFIFSFTAIIWVSGLCYLRGHPKSVSRLRNRQNNTSLLANHSKSTEHPVSLASLQYTENSSHICWTNAVDRRFECRLKCPFGYFSLPDSEYCTKWLGCDDFGQIRIQKELCSKKSAKYCRFHGVKQVYLARLYDQTVILANNTHGFVYKDPYRSREAQRLFEMGFQRLQQLQGNHTFVPQFLGGCPEKWYLTEYFPNGDLADFELVANSESFELLRTLKGRFHLCASLAETLHFIHHSPAGPLYNSDSLLIARALSQFVLSSNWNVVIADVDKLFEAVPGRKCEENQYQPFVAPEQLCDPEGLTIPPADLAKTDIWKFPFMCQKIIGEESKSPKYSELDAGLSEIFAKCWRNNVSERIDSDELVKDLKKLEKRIFE